MRFILQSGTSPNFVSIQNDTTDNWEKSLQYLFNFPLYWNILPKLIILLEKFAVAQLDSYDIKILAELQRDGRIAMADLAKRVGLSTSPCWRRKKRLEEAGIIRGYTAVVRPQSVGLGLNAFVYVSLNLHKAEGFEAAVQKRPEVIECYAMSGGQDYLVHVMCADMAAFDIFLRSELAHMPGVERVDTSFALKAIKQDRALPIA